jgi:hypothetical protein
MHAAIQSLLFLYAFFAKLRYDLHLRTLYQSSAGCTVSQILAPFPNCKTWSGIEWRVTGQLGLSKLVVIDFGARRIANFDLVTQ